MNDDQLDDLKQFITTTVSQTEARLTERIDDVEQGLSQRIDEFEQSMKDGFAGVGEAIEDIHKRDDEFDVRVTKLKQKAA